MSFRNLFFSTVAVGLAMVPGIAGASTSTQLRNSSLTRYNQEHNSVDHKIASECSGGSGSNDESPASGYLGKYSDDGSGDGSGNDGSGCGGGNGDTRKLSVSKVAFNAPKWSLDRGLF